MNVQVTGPYIYYTIPILGGINITQTTISCLVVTIILVAAMISIGRSLKTRPEGKQALAEKGVAFESHIYSYGGHGFSTGEDWINTNSVCPRLPHWVPDSIEWLGEVMGKLKRGGFTEPVSALSMNGNFAPVLSVDCTLSHLRRQSEEAKAVLAPMFAAIEAVAKARQFSVEGLMAAVGNNTAREIMEMVQIPAEAITEIDRTLHQMVNQLED